MMNSFRRRELKFHLLPGQRERILPRLLEHMDYDGYCRDGRPYTIRNIYFDTLRDDLVRRSNDRPWYKEKVRLRSYEGGTRRYLELKKKIGGTISKRRIPLTDEEARALLQENRLPERTDPLEAQILREIRRVFGQNPLEKQVPLRYDRLALYGKDDRDLRITLDQDLRSGEYRLLPEGETLMEVKILGAVPLWISRLLSEERAYSARFSKYGRRYSLERNDRRVL